MLVRIWQIASQLTAEEPLIRRRLMDGVVATQLAITRGSGHRVVRSSDHRDLSSADPGPHRAEPRRRAPDLAAERRARHPPEVGRVIGNGRFRPSGGGRITKRTCTDYTSRSVSERVLSWSTPTGDVWSPRVRAGLCVRAGEAVVVKWCDRGTAVMSINAMGNVEQSGKAAIQF